MSTITQRRYALQEEFERAIVEAEHRKLQIIHLTAKPFVNRLGIWRAVVIGAMIIDSFCILFHHTEFMTKRAIGSAWEHYSRKVVSHIPESTIDYKDQILDYCLSHTPIFYRYRQYCGHQLGNDTNIRCS